jgi:DNA-directed RNA polymerase specialized sigma24 family protein
VDLDLTDQEDFHLTILDRSESPGICADACIDASPGPGVLPGRETMIATIVVTIASLPQDSTVLPLIAEILGPGGSPHAPARGHQRRRRRSGQRTHAATRARRSSGGEELQTGQRGERWLALRLPRNTWSAEQRHLVRTAVGQHAGIAAAVRSCVAGWLDGAAAGRWRDALAALPSPAPEDVIGRFACACVLLRFAPLVRAGHAATLEAMDRYLAAVPYQLPGTQWLRIEQELYLARLAARSTFQRAGDPSQDAQQMLCARLLERALDRYKPGTLCDPERWVSEILKNIRIDAQRRAGTEARIFDFINPEEIPEQLLEHHSSAEQEAIGSQIHDLVRQMGCPAGAGGRNAKTSQEMTGKLSLALATLSNNMLTVLYMTLLPPPDSDAGIARQLNTPLPNIRKRRHDAIKALREALTGR